MTTLRTSAAAAAAPLCCLLAQSFAGELSAVPIRRLELCCGWLCYGASVRCPEIIDKMLLPECCELGRGCRSLPEPHRRSQEP
ncbi:hypothetical protein BDP55DRAFT_674340 [Colletotrichum godetiae]|uniref:Secreted protein n=1 Tax=Colletotrichum godetiae TaxID=1209918 RepID=A0AAJ0EQW4_9PEZI|nr:uncharacterized protein BDP55DRAFT_674340 [Colletotrichum godetiae]KAK1672082.1 hypothetical protein BDP55DRAFT_674340 [Colletotrichum godetiae]